MTKTPLNIPAKLDDQGYLIKTDSWNNTIAIAIAKLDKLELNEEHWFIINYLRRFYQEFPTLKIPAMRVMLKAMREQSGAAKADSLYFHQLFPKGLIQAYKIAGLPKTGRCSKGAF